MSDSGPIPPPTDGTRGSDGYQTFGGGMAQGGVGDNWQQFAPQGSPGNLYAAPPKHMVLAVVSLFFCLIGGIVAIVNASKVNEKWAIGDASGSIKASKNAQLWAWISIGIGVVSIAFRILAASARTV